MPRLDTPGGGGQNRAGGGAILCRIFPSSCPQAFWVSWAWQQTQPAESGSWLAPRNQSVVSPFPSRLDFFFLPSLSDSFVYAQQRPACLGSSGTGPGMSQLDSRRADQWGRSVQGDFVFHQC